MPKRLTVENSDILSGQRGRLAGGTEDLAAVCACHPQSHLQIEKSDVLRPSLGSLERSGLEPGAQLLGSGWGGEQRVRTGRLGAGDLPGQASAGGEQRKSPSPSAAPPVLALSLRPGRWRQRRGAGRRDPRVSRAAAAPAPPVVDAAARLAQP